MKRLWEKFIKWLNEDPHAQLEKEMNEVEWPENDITYERIPIYWGPDGEPNGWTFKQSREHTYMDYAAKAARTRDPVIKSILIRFYEKEIRKAIKELRAQGKVKTSENSQ